MKQPKLALIFLIFCFLSCKQNENKQTELDLKLKELQLKEKELELKEREKQLNEKLNESIPSYPQNNNHSKTKTENLPSIVKTKFCYVYIETNEPEEKYSFGDINGNGKGLYASPKYFNYKSSVIEVKNLTEDEKYKLIDRFEQQVRDQYEIKNMKLANLNAECRITSSECFSFDTYKAASEHRQKK